jgi:hypothetical protein
MGYRWRGVAGGHGGVLAASACHECAGKSVPQALPRHGCQHCLLLLLVLLKFVIALNIVLAVFLRF